MYLIYIIVQMHQLLNKFGEKEKVTYKCERMKYNIYSIF